MSDDVPKAVRVAEFLRRLAALAAASTAEEAFEQIGITLDAVEDELTATLNRPELWETDGRLYPPQHDKKRRVPGRSDVTAYRSEGHRTFIANNGAIEIRDLNGRVVFTKPGADGQLAFPKE